MVAADLRVLADHVFFGSWIVQARLLGVELRYAFHPDLVHEPGFDQGTIHVQGYDANHLKLPLKWNEPPFGLLCFTERIGLV